MVMKFSARAIVLCLCLGLAFYAGQPVTAHRGRGNGSGGGNGGPYKEEPKETATDKVNRIVGEAIKNNPGVGPALVRLVFHDCWVYGCDGSVLVDGSKTEKTATNNGGLGGFDVIDAVKKEVGGDLSCADIVVLAARDATVILSGGKINYPITTGRTDGSVSSPEAADAVLPPSTFDITQLKANFAKKRFTTTELTALSGAHVCGVAHLKSFEDRLDKKTGTPIDPDYRKALINDVEKQKKAQGTDNPIEPNNIRDMSEKFQTDSKYDPAGVNTAAKGVMDNSYYHANLQNRVLFRSDWELRTDSTAADNMTTFKNNANEWYLQFGNAMVKLSNLVGENPSSVNRTNCRVISKY